MERDMERNVDRATVGKRMDQFITVSEYVETENRSSSKKLTEVEKKKREKKIKKIGKYSKCPRGLILTASTQYLCGSFLPNHRAL